MKIIVTGGSGFIGSVLLPRLVAEGHSVIVLSRNPAAVRSGQRIGVEPWDGKTVGSWAKHLDGADAVLNFAGETLDKRWTVAQKERIVNSRVDATMAICDAISKAGRKPSVLVNASGVGFYGPVDDGDVAEDYPLGNTFLSETVARWEASALAVEKLGVRVVLLRTAVVLGTGGALRKMLLAFRLFAGGPLGSGRQWFPWVHIDDLVSVVLMALGDNSLSGPVNVAAPHAVRMKEFATELGRALHRPSWFPVPAFVLRMILGEMSSMVLTGQKAVPRVLQQRGYSFRFPELGPALADILK